MLDEDRKGFVKTHYRPHRALSRLNDLSPDSAPYTKPSWEREELKANILQVVLRSILH
jgi:hypothetical protein